MSRRDAQAHPRQGAYGIEDDLKDEEGKSHPCADPGVEAPDSHRQKDAAGARTILLGDIQRRPREISS